MRKNSIKNTRINTEVQRELSNILRGGIKDPRVAPMTSVVAVEVAPDLKTCKAYSACWEIRKPRKIRSKDFRVQKDISGVNWQERSTCAIHRRSGLSWISPLSTVSI